MSGGVVDLCHTATAEIAVPAEAALAYMSDGLALGEWSLGCLNTQAVEGDLFTGRSMFDGQQTWVRIAVESLAVTYHVGGNRERLSPWIRALVVPGPVTGRPEDHCLLTLAAWRGADAGEERWQRTKATHESEILLIKAKLETCGR